MSEPPKRILLPPPSAIIDVKKTATNWTSSIGTAGSNSSNTMMTITAGIGNAKQPSGGGGGSGTTTSTIASNSNFTTISSSSSSTSLSTSKSSSTIRLDLDLFEPNADSFPEFNYSKLLHIEKKKKKKISKLNGFSDPFEENNDDVDRIAKELERKYGNAYCTSRKGRSNNDYCDKGAGYDENDDFIDNTEAYDEIIPDEIETDRGGFYINSGALQFKQLPNFERPEDANRMPKPRKRALSTSSESSASEMETGQKSSGGTGLKNGHFEKKPKTVDKELSLHKVKEKKMVKLRLKDKKEDGGSDSGKDTKKPIKTTTVKDMLRAKRDSMRNIGLDSGEGGGSKSEQTEDSENESSSSDESSDSTDDDDDDDDGDDDNDDDERSDCRKDQRTGDNKLPENLPDNLLGYINKLTEAAKGSNIGKHNFFDTANMDLLYQIDSSARSRGPNVRNQIYNYLEMHLPCTKQTILMRAKKIRIKKDEMKTEKILGKLKAVVNGLMPDMLKNYESECKRITELRASLNQANGEKPEHNYKMPRKRFIWNEQTRNLICDLINSRKQFFSVIKQRKESIDDFVGRFLKESVVKIWPNGWMKIEELLKEYEKRKNSNTNKGKEVKKFDNVDISKTASTPEVPIVDNLMTNQKDLILNSSVLPAKSSVASSSSSTSTFHTSIQDEKVLSGHSTSIKNDSKITSTKMKSDTITKTSDPNSVAVSMHSTASKTVAVSSIQAATPTFGSSLTITPVGANDLTSKPLPSVQNKVTITNVEHSMRPSSQSTQIRTSPGLSDTITTSMSPNSKSSMNNNSTNAMNLSVSPSDHSQPTPTKRSTDHSINSIISSSPNNSGSGKSDTSIEIITPPKKSSAGSKSPSATAVTAVSTTASGVTTVAVTTTAAATVAAATTTTTTTTTHVINLDNLKTKNDILNTAAAQTKATSGTAPRSSPSPGECNIRIRSVETVNSFLDSAAAGQQAASIFSTGTAASGTNSSSVTKTSSVSSIRPEDVIEEIDSSSSDDVEFVGVSVNPVKRPPTATTSTTAKNRHKSQSATTTTTTTSAPVTSSKVSKLKSKERNAIRSRSNSPKITNFKFGATANKVNAEIVNEENCSGVSSSGSGSGVGGGNGSSSSNKRKRDQMDSSKDGDFDVNQIMKELKELQPLSSVEHHPNWFSR